ncbi:MAG: VWA-like domain-containing protein [Nanoarchaeota archaeon]|nr:VWA-like domain-containing protein [Nanoarchaeota archaeon]
MKGYYLMSFDALETKLLKAKIELMSKSVFISTIALSIKHIISDKVSTAATNGNKIWYNPDFIKDLSIPEFVGLIAHECWHIAFLHLSRGKGKDPERYNEAGDYVINNMLTSSRFKIPPGGLVDKKYKDMTTEQVYDILMAMPKTPENMMKDLTEAPEENVSEQNIKATIVRANTQATLAGQKPGELPEEISRLIDELLDPKLPWEQLLHKFIDNTIKTDFNWNRRNRRYKEYLPSRCDGGLSHLTFAIDTSGSVSDKAVQELLSEIQYIQDTFCPERMTIIDCDTKINHIHEVDQSTRISELEFIGGGGTRFHPVVNYVNDHPTQALIYFTDLYGDSDVGEVGYPILWICNSDADPAKVGETIYLEES